MSNSIFNPDQRLTRAQKNADNKRWYREKITNFDAASFNRISLFNNFERGHNLTEHGRMKINYDLFNNTINRSDFEKVCYPYGKDAGALPVDFTNKDIVSGKVKALLGMEMNRPFSWSVIATNEEATTRKEQKEMDMIREYVVNSIMEPIRFEVEKEFAQQAQGQELTPEQEKELQQQIQQELQARTPPEVATYMAREHQDPTEVMASQILEYLIQEQDIKNKFDLGLKHGLLSAKEIFWVGNVGPKPTVKVVNPLRFDYDRNPENRTIQEGEWACQEINMSPSQVMMHFGDELTPFEIDEIYEEYNHMYGVTETDFTFTENGRRDILGIRVLHAEWKALKAVKFLTYQDLETGEIHMEVVDEEYKLNPEVGDIRVETEWVVAKYEGYQIGRDKYALLREVPGQYKDFDNLYDCKLSYIGAAYDNLNSEAISLMDRMKDYQYMYNIINYRIELLMASDEGKSVLLNTALIPKNTGVDLEKWMYYWKVNKIGLMDPTEEGNKGTHNIGEAAKEIDLSLISDIQKYVELAEYVERRCGESVGITKEIEGQIANNAAVRNTQQAIVASSNILEPYFAIHNMIKRDVLQSLIECAKVTYAQYQPKTIAYTLDDMSNHLLSIDFDLLDNSTYGIFVANSAKSSEALDMIKQLSHAALQNQRAELSDVIKIMNSDSIQQAEELLVEAERERNELEQQNQQAQAQQAEEAAENARAWEREKLQIEHDNKMAEIELKGEIDIQKQAILSMGFNEDKDLDKDGVPDVLEVAKFGVDAEIKRAKIDLDREKLDYQKVQDGKKNQLEKEKIAVAKAKSNQAQSRASDD